MLVLVFDTEKDCNKFVDIYENYKKYMYYTIGLFIQDKYLQEDILQEIAIIVAKNLHHIDLTDEKRTRNYIITITRNYCKNYIRNQNRKKEESFDEFIEQSSASELPLDVMISKEVYRDLLKEIGQLDDKYKTVFELKYINDFNDDQIAEFLKISKKNVQMRIYRAKLMLRQKLGERYYV